MATLTQAQLTFFKEAINASTNPDVIAARDPVNDVELERLYNLPTSFVCWKTNVSEDEIMQNGFDWTQVDNQTVGKARIWDWLFRNTNKSINPSKVNVRAGIDEAWKGTSAMLAVRAAVYVHCKRTANEGEKVFATGTGTDAIPGTFSVEGTFTVQNMSDVMRAS
jgi:hypothetical protein